MAYNSRDDVYFVDLQGLEYLDALVNKIEVYRNFISSTNMLNRWSLSFGAFFGVSKDGKVSWEVTPGGEFGEVVQHKVNDYASLIRHEHVLAVQNRPAGVAKAINMDAESLRAARIGSQLIEYYFTDPSHRFESDYTKALLLALIAGESYLLQEWDMTVGPEVRPDENGKMIRSGDITQAVYAPWNAARDIGSQDPGSVNWFILSSKVNKFELAAKYPAFREQILLDAKNRSINIKRTPFSNTGMETDFIELHKLVHFPTEACPTGRLTTFIENHVLLDSDYVYRHKCVHRCEAGETLETSFGHTPNYDLLSLEQVTDSLNSIASNAMATFGSPVIVGPKGGGVAHQDLGKAGHYLEIEPQFVEKIKALDLGKLPEALIPILQMYDGKKGQLSGINSILRGDPQGALKGASGSAMALLQSQAITYNSANQVSYYRLLSSAGTGIIEMMRQYALEPRILKIAGKVNQAAIKEFKYDANTLSAISTVVFEPVNPVLQTTAGKLSLAETLLQGGLITDPNDYIEVLSTGNLSVITNSSVTLKEAIIEENEKLMKGERVQAVITENHEKHIAQHSVIIAMPDAKEDPQIVQNALEHIFEHANLWMQASQLQPSILIATGQQVLPTQSAPMQGNAPMPQGDMPQAGPDQTGTTQPNLPQPPIDPGTGERAIVAQGTDVRI